MELEFNRNFDSSLLLLVCHKNDLDDSLTEDTIFLVYKNEWQVGIDDEIELLCAKVEGNCISLYPAPNNAVIISRVIPYSSKEEYIEL